MRELPAFSAATPATAYHDLRLDLNSSFAALRGDIAARSKILDKPLRARVAAWLAKLSEETRNEAWMKNRNAYAKLMLEQLKHGRLEEPFHGMPPESPLPTLNRAYLYAYAKPKGSGRSSAAKPRHRLTPSQELDGYLGGHLGGAAPPSPQPFALPAATPTAQLMGVYGGTAAQAPPPTAASAFRPSAASASAALDFELGLGGLGEHSELEDRVAETEEKLRRHSELLALALEVSAASTRGGGGGAEACPQQRARCSVNDVLKRAQGWTAAKRSTPAAHRAKPHPTPEAALPAPLPAAPSEEALAQAMAAFETETEALRAKIGAVGLGMFSSEAAAAPILAAGEESRRRRRKLPEPETIPPRHTLKSAAAAAAARRSLGDDYMLLPALTTAAAPRPACTAGSSAASAAALLRLRPGSTAALVSEVAALRKRLAASLEALGDGGSSGGDLGLTLPAFSSLETSPSPLGTSSIGISGPFGDMSPPAAPLVSAGGLAVGA